MFVLVIGIAESNGLIVFKGDPVDLSVLFLTAATVVLTAVAVMTGVAAFFGYNELKASAVKEAVEKAQIEATKTAQAVAEAVVARSRFEPKIDGTTPQEADQLVKAQEEELRAE